MNNNTATQMGAPLEGQNVCYPPTVSNWEVQAPRCLNATTEQECPRDICVWSSGAQFIPEGVEEVCSSKFVTQDAGTYAACWSK